MAELRERLQIRSQDGFYLSTERLPSWRRRASAGVGAGDLCVLRRGYVEAAARLDLWLDFDVRAFDALCVCLQGEPQPAPAIAPGDGFGRTPSSASSAAVLRSPQYCRLCEWLLELSARLLDPAVPAAPTPEASPGPGWRQPTAMLVRAVTLRNSSNGSIHPPSANDADIFGLQRLPSSASTASNSRSIGSPYAGIKAADGSTLGKSESHEEVEELEAPAATGGGLEPQSSAAERFRYFEERVCRAQVIR